MAFGVGRSIVLNGGDFGESIDVFDDLLKLGAEVWEGNVGLSFGGGSGAEFVELKYQNIGLFK
jgi:hypothetical protein